MDAPLLPPPPSPASDKLEFNKTEKLKEAALNGDVNFLKESFASYVPLEYYFTMFYDETHNLVNCTHCGNILHLAVLNHRQEFIREAVQNLPTEAKHKLLTDQRCSNNKSNPLHLAVKIGNLDIVKVFLNVYRSSPSLTPKPWLMPVSDMEPDETLCNYAISCRNEECALEVLSMDMEFFCNTTDGHGYSLLSKAIIINFSNLALKILRSDTTFSCASNYSSPLHMVANLKRSEGEEICRLLLEKTPNLVEYKDKFKWSVLHEWAFFGILWPFEFVLKNNNGITPDVRRAFIDLISATDNEGRNPLHILARVRRTVAMDIAIVLIDAYKQEVAVQASSISNNLFPWLALTDNGDTVLTLAIKNSFWDLVDYILSVDDTCLRTWNHLHPLFLARQNGHHHYAESILTKVVRSKFHIIHSWVNIGEIRPFEDLPNMLNLGFSKIITELIDSRDENGNTLFHVAATSSASHEATHRITEHLVDAFKNTASQWISIDPAMLPWFVKNKVEEGPLELAICNQRQPLALYLLSTVSTHSSLLHYYDYKIMFLAIQNKCYDVAKDICSKLDMERLRKHLNETISGQNVLHLAPSCPEEFGRWLVKISPPEFITQKDKEGRTPLHLSSEVGVEWLIKDMLTKDPLAFEITPSPWIKACEQGHVPAIRAFINNCSGNFYEHCLKNKDSPLHHINLQYLTRYEDFLKIPGMKDFINVQDSRGATPLHTAILNKDIPLTEALLKMDSISCKIKDHENKSAQDLLKELSTEGNEWDLMCKRVNFDPKIKTSYFERQTNLLDVRNTLSVVAALLATITFTAGFTIPGGFDQSSGEAVLAKKAAFLVFLISDTLAMCCSMLVLICLIWSMVYDDPNKSLFLVDRSMILLMAALYSTLLAFMTGVFIVISPKSMWSAIVVIVMCSLLVISAKRDILYKVLEVIPSPNRDDKDPICQMELGETCSCRRGCTCFKCN